jgi:phage shock protein A
VVPGISTVVTVIVGILGISGIVGAVIAYMRTNIAKTTIDLYKETNQALQARVDQLEHDKVVLDKAVAKAEGRIAQLEDEQQMLRDLATGRSAVDALTELSRQHHREVMRMLEAIQGTMELMCQNGQSQGAFDDQS